MKLGIKTLAIAVVITSAIACESEKKQNDDATVNERTEQIEQDFQQKKNEWVAKLKAEIGEVEKRIEKAKDDSQLEERLENAKVKLERNLEKIEKSTENTWIDVKKDVNNAYDDVKNELNAIGEKIGNEFE
jgi:TolA-binding protein